MRQSDLPEPPRQRSRSRSICQLTVALIVSALSTVAIADDENSVGPKEVIVQACTSLEQPDRIETWMASAAQSLPVRKPVIDVKTLGALPDDDIDDTDALEKIPAGHTIHFPSGTFLVSRSLRLKPGTTYTGSGTLKRAKPGAGFIMIAKTVTDVAIAGLTFSGGGIIIGGAKAVRVERNRFLDIVDQQAKFGQEAGIFINGTLTDSLIVGNQFSRIGFSDGKRTTQHGSGILAYHLQNVTIASNRFSNIHQGISVIFEGKRHTGNGLRVIDNVVVNPLRMGIEVGGKGMTSALIEGNCVRAKRIGDEDVGLSIVADGEGTIIRRNLVIQVQPENAECAGIGIEVAGRKAAVARNVVAGHWCAAIATYNERSWSTSITGNQVCGHRGDHDAIDLVGGIGKSLLGGNELQQDCPDSLLVPLQQRAAPGMQ